MNAANLNGGPTDNPPLPQTRRVGKFELGCATSKSNNSNGLPQPRRSRNQIFEQLVIEDGGFGAEK